ncbi:MAG: MerR family transcriptional regulator [Pseudomonadota bacterium]
MKISELAKMSEVPKETIHFYIREGLLPKPQKRGRNVADYDEHYVELIRLIKSLQEQLYLPLALIKKIMRQARSPSRQSSLEVRSDYFKPESRLLEQDIKGEEAFRKETGLARRWLANLEDWGLISPRTTESGKIYSQDDVTIGRLVVDMGRLGLGPTDGFDPEALRHYHNLFRKIARLSNNYFFRALWGKVPLNDLQTRSIKGREILSVFFYHFYLKLSNEEFHNTLNLVKKLEEDGADPFEALVDERDSLTESEKEVEK